MINKSTLENSIANKIDYISSIEFKVHKHQQNEVLVLPVMNQNFFNISYLQSNSTFSNGKETIEIKQPSLYFSTPQATPNYKLSAINPAGYTCTFDNAFLGANNLVFKLTNSTLQQSPFFTLTKEQDNFIHILFKKIEEESKDKTPQKIDLLRKYIEILIYKSYKLQNRQVLFCDKTAKERLCQRFLDLLEMQFTNEIGKRNINFKKNHLRTASNYADKLNVHVNHLNFTLNQALGKSTTTCIKERMLQEAQALLKTSTLSISEVAYILGFEHPTYFSSFFKKEMILTPNQYRREHKK